MNTRHRRFAAVLLAFALAAPLAAQPPRPGGRHRLGPDPRVVAEYLDLDETQERAFRDLVRELEERNRPLREEQRALHQQLRDLLEGGAADSEQRERVGALVLELRDNRAQLRAAREAQLERFAAGLDAGQKAKLAALRGWMEARRRGPMPSP